ncbi:plastid delta12-fatty acid acetylenase [Tanacetum coccineum]|uniref:Plastid delta12-fatty acid acetylenase n=1 Tax=Tanacetum coccineum TaxID=301880 RepID=A0ABQ4Y494_9ASTR
MGAGGRMSGLREQAKDGILKRVPTDPPFSLSDLKKTIPAHCFEHSVIRSSYYVVRDLIVMYVFYFLANTYIPLLPTPLACLAWPFYWFCQASILTGLWVIGHECGHHAFSEYQLVDDIVGFVLHSALFTPYFSWKYSHQSHHANTNSLDNDEVYIPKRKSKVMIYSKVLNNPPGRVFTLVFRLTSGFLYIFNNVLARNMKGLQPTLIPLSPISLSVEARDAIKPVLGDYYKIDRTSIFKAMWREAKECMYIEPDQDNEHKVKDMLICNGDMSMGILYPRGQNSTIPGDMSMGILFPGDMSPGKTCREKLEGDSFPGNLPRRHIRAHTVSVNQNKCHVGRFLRRHVAGDNVVINKEIKQLQLVDSYSRRHVAGETLLY